VATLGVGLTPRQPMVPIGGEPFDAKVLATATCTCIHAAGKHRQATIACGASVPQNSY